MTHRGELRSLFDRYFCKHHWYLLRKEIFDSIVVSFAELDKI
ncbi:MULTISPECIES: hypothetical protein [Oscillatoriales]|nr:MULTISPECIES: hypothetical protein [Oscillatoriales]